MTSEQFFIEQELYFKDEALRFKRECLNKGFIHSLQTLFAKHGAFIAGGALTSWFTNQPINDFDIYFPSKEALEEFVKEVKGPFYNYQLKESFQSAFAHNWVNAAEERVQFITKEYGTPRQIIDGFDFTINAVAYDFKTQNIISCPSALIDITKKQLVFQKSPSTPINSFYRIFKYLKRGYTIDELEVLKGLMYVRSLEPATNEEMVNAVKGFSEERMHSLGKKFKLDNDFDQGEFLKIVESLKKGGMKLKKFGL